jgi:putative nucleotidyltransferase with HDIG domain
MTVVRAPRTPYFTVSPEFVQALVRLLEAKDPSTGAHTWRVVLYTRALAEELGVARDVIGRLTVAAALHDVGKIDIPEAVLLKPGPLTDDERAVMRTHAALGWERLRRMDEVDPMVLDLVRHHHERLDGAGYPDALRGEAIPAPARWFAVIDSFDAMTSVRPYRAIVGDEAGRRAAEEIERHAGLAYDAQAAGAFVSLYRTGRLDWILHYFNDECPLPDYGDIARPDELRRHASRGG